MEVPPCHARELRFCAIDEENSLKNLNKGLPGNNVHFRENVLAALVIMKWSGINLEAGRPLCLRSLKTRTGCQFKDANGVSVLINSCPWQHCSPTEALPHTHI